jgi:hypothetical protein
MIIVDHRNHSLFCFPWVFGRGEVSVGVVDRLHLPGSQLAIKGFHLSYDSRAPELANGQGREALASHLLLVLQS